MLTTVAGKVIVTKHYLAWLIGGLSTVAVWLVGDYRIALLLMSLMAMDWLTGCIKSLRRKTFSSWTFQRMAFNLVARFTLVSCAYWIGVIYPPVALLHLHDILILFFCQGELISIAENLHAIDERIVPAVLVKYLAKAGSLDAIKSTLLPAMPINETVTDPEHVCNPTPAVDDQ